MVDGDYHYVVTAGQIRAVIDNERTGALRVPAAVQPYHYRPAPSARTRSPHVQTEAVFVRRLPPIDSGHLGNQGRRTLRRARTELHSIADPCPGFRFGGRHKTPRPSG